MTESGAKGPARKDSAISTGLSPPGTPPKFTFTATSSKDPTGYATDYFSFPERRVPERSITPGKRRLEDSPPQPSFLRSSSKAQGSPAELNECEKSIMALYPVWSALSDHTKPPSKVPKLHNDDVSSSSARGESPSSHANTSIRDSEPQDDQTPMSSILEAGSGLISGGDEEGHMQHARQPAVSPLFPRRLQLSDSDLDSRSQAASEPSCSQAEHPRNLSPGIEGLSIPAAAGDFDAKGKSSASANSRANPPARTVVAPVETPGTKAVREMEDEGWCTEEISGFTPGLRHQVSRSAAIRDKGLSEVRMSPVTEELEQITQCEKPGASCISQHLPRELSDSTQEKVGRKAIDQELSKWQRYGKALRDAVIVILVLGVILLQPNVCGRQFRFVPKFGASSSGGRMLNTEGPSLPLPFDLLWSPQGIGLESETRSVRYPSGRPWATASKTQLSSPTSTGLAGVSQVSLQIQNWLRHLPQRLGISNADEPGHSRLVASHIASIVGHDSETDKTVSSRLRGLNSWATDRASWGWQALKSAVPGRMPRENGMLSILDRPKHWISWSSPQKTSFEKARDLAAETLPDVSSLQKVKETAFSQLSDGEVLDRLKQDAKRQKDILGI